MDIQHKHELIPQSSSSALYVQQFGRGMRPPKPKKRKPLSPRRAREFRDRYLKRMFGDRKARTARHAGLFKIAQLFPELMPAWWNR